MRGHLGQGAPYGGHAPGVTRAMVTHGLQLVLWTPWPQALQCTSRRRYCVNGAGYRSHYTCETTGHTPAAVLDAHPERRRGTVSGPRHRGGTRVMRAALRSSQADDAPHKGQRGVR